MPVSGRYASKLKLPTLIILLALYITEHLVGVKGLFLALPTTVYASAMIYGSDPNNPLSSKEKKSQDTPAPALSSAANPAAPS